MPDAPAYLLLKLRSCDDFDQWLRPVPHQQPLLAELTLAYSDEVAALRPFAHVEVKFSDCTRRFAVLSVTPVQELRHAVALQVLPPLTPEADVCATSWSAEFTAGPELARDISRLAALLERQQTTQSLAYQGAAGSDN